MANHYILYETATGRAVSQTSNPSVLDINKPGMAVATVDDSELRGTWNESTLSFDPRPEQRVIDKLGFLDLFTTSELEGIIGSNHSKVKVFIQKLQLADPLIDLKSARMVAAVNGMETLGLIATGRAAEILNG